jgi:AcrR family transcriptional regulator
MPMNTRLTADERRDEVVAAASIEFAGSGYAGTSTASIARRAGVSQPYLFQLFGTKKDLFIAAVLDCFDRTRLTFEHSGKLAADQGLDSKHILGEMGHAYVRLLLGDRNILRLQLQAYAACHDPEIQTVVRDNYAVLWQVVARVSGGDPQAVHAWFAEGMLINVVASISNATTMEEFFQSLPGGAVAPC